MEMIKRISLGVVIMVLLGLTACALMSGNLTPEKKYLTALTWYNDNLEIYLDSYDRASEATRSKWDAEIKPLFEEAGAVLDLWAAGQAGETDWASMRTRLVLALINSGLIVVEEEE